MSYILFVLEYKQIYQIYHMGSIAFSIFKMGVYVQILFSKEDIVNLSQKLEDIGLV